MNNPTLQIVQVKNPDELNLILGQSHFIKTVEDLHEAIVNTVPNVKFGLAFSEASGPRLIRSTGTDPELTKLAEENMMNIGCGHSFIIFLKEAFPINILNVVKSVPEVAKIYCATANPLQVVIAQSKQGRGIIGVIDGGSPTGIETNNDKSERHQFLRDIGYKL